MAKTAKTINYTPEQTALVVSSYLADKSPSNVEKIAQALGKSVRSVTSKLVREKVYEKKVYVSKTGAPVALKNDTADAIGKVLGLGENDVSSLTKATKPALAAIWKMIVDADNHAAIAEAVEAEAVEAIAEAEAE